MTSTRTDALKAREAIITDKSVTEIAIFDAADRKLASLEIPAYQVGKRMSVWAANAQRKLDKLAGEYPEATKGHIGATKFRIANGRSLAVW